MTKHLAWVAVLLALAAAIPAEAAYVCRLNPRGDNFLSLRSGPGTGYSEITHLDPDTELNVLDQEGAWLRVRTGGLIGWVYSRYVCD